MAAQNRKFMRAVLNDTYSDQTNSIAQSRYPTEQYRPSVVGSRRPQHPRDPGSYISKSSLQSCIVPTLHNKTIQITNSYVESSVVSKAGSRAPTVREKTGIGICDTGPSDYVYGQIVWIIHLTPNLNPYAVFGPNVVEAQTTGTICAKVRPAIVTHIYEDHLVVAPIYSASGNGLKYKSIACRSNCVPIVNPEGPGPEFYEGMTDDFFEVGPGFGQTMKNGAYVALTELVCVNYACPIKKVGQLSPQSKQLMLEKVKVLFEKGQTPFGPRRQESVRTNRDSYSPPRGLRGYDSYRPPDYQSVRIAASGRSIASRYGEPDSDGFVSVSRKASMYRRGR